MLSLSKRNEKALAEFDSSPGPLVQYSGYELGNALERTLKPKNANIINPRKHNSFYPMKRLQNYIIVHHLRS